MEKRYERKTKERDPWEGFPETYKSMLMAMCFSDGDYCIKEALRFLQENKVGKNEYSGNAKLNYLRWTDRFFRELSTIVSNEEFWKENIETLEDILRCTEGYLKDLSGDYHEITHAHRTEAGYQDDTNLVNIIQTLDFYFSLLYWHKGKAEEFRERLGNIFSATMRNVRYVVFNENARELIKLDFHGMDGFDSVEFIFWTPLSWLYDEACMREYVHELIPVYEEYVEFLSGMDGEMDSIVRDRFLLDAETNLQNLYDINFEHMADEGLVDEKCYDDYFAEKTAKITSCEKRIEKIKLRLYEDRTDLDSSRQTELANKWEIMRADIKNNISITEDDYQSWIEPLVYDWTDVTEGIMYLRWCEASHMIWDLKRRYQDLLDITVKEHVPGISHVEITASGRYHKEWRSFTMDLIEYLTENPGMPVVVYKENDRADEKNYYSNRNNTECRISYVYDPETGEFIEKVIAIYVNNPKKTEDEFMVSEDEIPF